MKNSIVSAARPAVVLCALAALFFVACKSKQVVEAETEQTFKVVSPIVRDTNIQKEYVAEIAAIQNVEIRPRVKGVIEKLYVDEGQAVRAGQLLFSINSLQFQQALQKAQAETKSAVAEVAAAQIELANTQKLVEKNIVSKPEADLMQAKIEALKAQVEKAQAEQKQAELDLSFAQIHAPFDGTINRIPNKQGSLVDETTLLTTISNSKEVFAYFNVAERDYLDYLSVKKTGKPMQVQLTLANGNPYAHPGVVETTESEFNKETGNLAFRARFPNPEQLLKHGSSGKIVMKNSLKNALLIPQKSTFELQDLVYVFVVDEAGVVHQRQVEIAAQMPHLYAVRSGLDVHDKILFEGLQKVKDGEKVSAETIQFSQIKNL